MVQGDEERQPVDDPGGRRYVESGSAAEGIQAAGFLVALAADWTVTHVSRNAPTWLGRGLDEMFERPFSAVLGPDAVHALRGRLQLLNCPEAAERLPAVTLQDGGQAFDLTLYRSGGSVIVEAEPSQPEVFDAAELVRTMLRRLQQSEGVAGLCREATRQMRVLTGFDSVMVCRFESDGTASVVARSARSSMPAEAGRRFRSIELADPASEASARIRPQLIADAATEPVAIAARPGTPPLDLSTSSLRAPGPLRLQWLRDRGIGAALAVPILHGDRPWGVLVCQSLHPRRLTAGQRTAAELFGQLFSLMLESRERAGEAARHPRP